MNEILSKLSSYNLFNYLFSGIVFVVLCKSITPYNFTQNDPVVALFVYYFIGLVISRVGSIIIEPFLKKTGFVKFADYADYVAASKVDPKLETLSESNNMYRTLFAVFITLALTKVYGVFELQKQISGTGIYILFILLSIIFLFGYKKQTAYISKRVKAYLEKK